METHEPHYKTEEPSMRRGMALVTVLAIILICSVFVTLTYYFVYRGTEITGIEKRYRTAREASVGAIEIFTKEVVTYGIGGTTLTSIMGKFPSGSVAKGSLTDECFSSKLTKKTSGWPDGCDSSIEVTSSYDLKFTLKGQSSEEKYNVYVKIVDTVPGNTSKTEMQLEGSGVTESTTGLVSVQHFPYLYKIEAQGEKENSAERVNLSVLYAY